MRHTGAGDDARGADRAGADADLQPIEAERDEVLGAFVRGDVSRDELHFRQPVLDGFDGLHHAVRMAVGGVDGEDVGFGLCQFHGAFEKISRRADGRADAQASLVVFGGARILELFLDVLYGDEAFQIEVLVHDEELFDAVLLEDALGLLERGANGHGDEIFLRHHGADRERMILFEAQVAVGKDSGEARAAGDGQAGDAVLGHDLEGLAEGDVRRDGDGVHDHAAFRTLHAVHFLSLAVHGHVAVNHADAALAGDGDGETRFGDRVHGR